LTSIQAPCYTGEVNIFLIGMMGSGKTTVGKKLAEDLGWPFRDSDSEIVEEAGGQITRMDGNSCLFVQNDNIFVFIDDI